MSVGYTPETFGLLIVLAFAGVLGLGVVWRLLRGALKVAGVTSDGWALVALATLLGAGLLAGSVALDTQGERAPVVVTSKRETLWVTRRGGWNRTYQVSARATGAGPEQIVNLSPSQSRYDSLAEGDQFGVRMLRAGSLSVIRDERDSTRTVLPWPWLLGGGAALVVLVLAWRLVASLVVVVVVIGGVTLPLVNAYRDWLAAENLAPMTERATATVRDVTRVTEWRLSSRQTSRSQNRAFENFELPQHYDVVSLDLTPAGARTSVLGVDAVDVATGSPPVLAPGAHVDVRFAAGDPRDVRLDGRTRRWHWRDMVSVYTQIWGVLAILVVGALAWAWVMRRARRAARARR